jgi:acyl-CoA dehydrogenase
MSEPDVASSDADQYLHPIRRDGDDYVINGRKWFITGALHPNCRLAIVMGVSNDAPDAPAHQRHSMVLVPMDAPGLEIVRNMPVMNHAPDGHCEMVFKNVRVPAANLLGEGGRALRWRRRGWGRVGCTTACAPSASASWRWSSCANARWSAWPSAALVGLRQRAGLDRRHSRVEIDQARLLVLRAAWLMDRTATAARVDVSAIKLVAAQLQTRVLDRAMQIFGAMGLTPDTPLA